MYLNVVIYVTKTWIGEYFDYTEIVYSEWI